MGPEQLQIGCNLRMEFIDLHLDKPPAPVMEFIGDNWLSSGPHHEKLDAIRSESRLNMHCVGMNVCGRDPLNWDYLAKVRELDRRYHPDVVSDHMAVQADGGVYFHDLLPFERNPAALKRIADRIHAIQDFLGRELVLENLTQYVQLENSPMSEAEFLAEIVSVTGCGLLLDVTNLWINEVNLGVDRWQELDKIPLDAVREIHLAGGQMQDDVLIDSHSCRVVPEVLADLQAILSVFRSQEISIIYERDNELSWEETLSEMQRIGDYLAG